MWCNTFGLNKGVVQYIWALTWVWCNTFGLTRVWCNTFGLKQGCGAILLSKGVVQYLNKGVVQYFWT